MLCIPRQLFTSSVNTSKPRDIVSDGFLKFANASLVLSATDNALRSGNLSLAPQYLG